MLYLPGLAGYEKCNNQLGGMKFFRCGIANAFGIRGIIIQRPMRGGGDRNVARPFIHAHHPQTGIDVESILLADMLPQTMI
jgi:hypothetical protein